jgi:hypothetical protein
LRFTLRFAQGALAKASYKGRKKNKKIDVEKNFKEAVK